MWQRFTESARKAVFYAQEEAAERKLEFVGTEQLLLGILRDPNVRGTIILTQLGVDLVRLRTEIESKNSLGEGAGARGMTLTPEAKHVIDCAYSEARDLHCNYIGTEHLLLGILRQGDNLAAKTLASFGIAIEAAREELKRLERGEPDPSPRTRDTGLQDIFQRAREEAGDPSLTIKPEYFLLALLLSNDNLASKILAEYGVTYEEVKKKVQDHESGLS